MFARWRQADSGAIDLAAVRADCGLWSGLGGQSGHTSAALPLTRHPRLFFFLPRAGSLVAPLVHCGASEQERRERKLSCETTVASFIDEYMCCVPAGSSSSEQTSDDLSESDGG